jgi:hypothetical protein
VIYGREKLFSVSYVATRNPVGFYYSYNKAPEGKVNWKLVYKNAKEDYDENCWIMGTKQRNYSQIEVRKK